MSRELHHDFATVNGVRLHYVRAGSGPLVLLLHGFPEFWYSWRYQIDALAEDYTVVAVDQRGYNTSSKPQSVRAYRVSELVQDVRELIPALGFSTATVVGHDWGGVVAWCFAAQHPGLVQRLAVLNLPYPALMYRAFLTNWRQRMRSWYMLFFQLPWLPELLLRRKNFAFMVDAFRSWMRQGPGTFSAADAEHYRAAWSQPGSLTAMINWYRAVFRYDQRANWTLAHEQISVPSLLIWGTADVSLGQELTYGTERYVPDLRIRYLSGISHWVQQEAPDAVNAALREFFQTT